ncbi:MAG: tape measure protein [Vulcanococcus sp.]
MAESLGRATFDILLDTTAFKAGIEQVRTLAARAGKGIEEALGPKASKGTLASLDIRINSLREEIRLVEIGSAKYKELARQIKLATQERDKAEGGAGLKTGGLGGGLRELAGAAGLTVSFAALTAAIASSVKAAAEFETVTRKLENTLGSGGAADALQFTKGLADQLGQSYLRLSDDFGTFTAAASASGVPLQQQRDVFKAVATAGQRLGLSNDQVSGSLQALQQIASKGTVQMEELRGQLGDRLPVALAAAAQGLGVNQKQLIGLVESGKLTAAEFFPALTKGLNELTKGAGGALTLNQQLGQLGNAWTELQVELGKTLFPLVTAGVSGLTAALSAAAKSTNALVIAFAGIGAAAATFYVLANATQLAAKAQAVLASAAAVAQTILNPANATKVAIALGVGAATAAVLGVSLNQASAQQAKLTQEADRSKVKLLEANNAAKQGLIQQEQAQLRVLAGQQQQLQLQKQNLEAQELRLGTYRQETDLINQINKIRNDAAVGRSQVVSTLLDQELQQAQALAANDQQRRQLEISFGQAKFNQTVREFDLKARALAAEQAGQQASLSFERQKVEAANQRARIEAQLALVAARRAYLEKPDQQNAAQLRLAREQLDLVVKQQSQEQQLGQQRQQLLAVQQAAQQQELAGQRLIALNSQAQNTTLEQQRQLQADVSRELQNQGGYADAAAVSADNFKKQLQGAATARGELSTAFQAQVNTVLDGTQQFTQMNSFLGQIVKNTAQPPNVVVNVQGGKTGTYSSVNAPKRA